MRVCLTPSLESTINVECTRVFGGTVSPIIALNCTYHSKVSLANNLGCFYGSHIQVIYHQNGGFILILSKRPPAIGMCPKWQGGLWFMVKDLVYMSEIGCAICDRVRLHS